MMPTANVWHVCRVVSIVGDSEGRIVCSSGSSTTGSISYCSNSSGTVEEPADTERETEQGLSL